MRLNKTSMDKLYDLMTMGFKHQMMRALHPSHLLQITLNHLDAVRHITDNSGVCELLDGTVRSVIDAYAPLSQGELWNLRYTLCRFFQDRRVKVSLFLQDGLQNMDGTLVLDVSGPLPPGSEVPGSIRYFESGKLLRTDKLPGFPGVVTVENSMLSDPRSCKLGDNLYVKERKSARTGTATAPAAGPEGTTPSTDILSGVGGTGPDTARKSGGVSAGEESSKYKPEEESGGSGGPGVGRAALDLLATLVRGGESKEDDTFRFSLFGDDGAMTNSSMGGGGGGMGSDIITFDAGDQAALRTMLSRIGWGEDGATAGGRAEGKASEDTKDMDGDDLLAMMDEVA